MMFNKIDEGYDFVYGWWCDCKDVWLNCKLFLKIVNGFILCMIGFLIYDFGCILKVMWIEIV